VYERGADYILALRSTGATLKKGRLAFGGSGNAAWKIADFLFRSLNETSL